MRNLYQTWANKPPLRILVTGASGLLGSCLVPFLRAGGHEVIVLKRAPAGAPSTGPAWDIDSRQIDLRPAGPLDAAVHLAGESIAGRWSTKKRDRILQSRIAGTALLCEALARLARPPKVVVTSSAIGYYGDCGDETLTEASPPGKGFLAEVCHAWEQASAPVEAAGTRVVRMRFGMVLSAAGGALAKMLTPFRLGFGGPLGNGQQYWSWIAIDDAVAAIEQAIQDDSLAGPINATAPEPLTNREFVQTLGRVLHRPALLPMPAGIIRLLLGEMGENLLLASARVLPTRLLACGFQFTYPSLDAALRHLLGG